MRVVGEIPHPHCKITIFSWNNRYLVKFESGPLEQTFKISELDITGEQELYTIINDAFIQKCLQRFATMQEDLQQALAASW